MSLEHALTTQLGGHICANKSRHGFCEFLGKLYEPWFESYSINIAALDFREENGCNFLIGNQITIKAKYKTG